MSFCMFSGSDWALYIGLTVVGAICVALGAGLARGARKGRRLPPYSIARTGKLTEQQRNSCIYILYILHLIRACVRPLHHHFN